MVLFPTQEIGSIDKFGSWRIKGITKTKKLTGEDRDELERQRRLYGVNGRELKHDLDQILRKPERTQEDRTRVIEWSAVFAIRFFESAGLDIVYSGEQFRSEMYQQPTDNINGFEQVGWVRSKPDKKGSKYFRKCRVVSEPELKKPFHLEEFIFTREHTSLGKIVKVPITGAYTLADWSFDEFYLKKLLDQGVPLREAEYPAKRELTMAIVRNCLRPHIEALVRAGAQYIQIDEPAGGTKPNEVDIFVDSYNETVRGLPGKFSLHVCFPHYYCGYDILFPELQRLENCSMLTWEFANQDTDHNFESYKHILGLIKQYTPDKEVGLGVLDVHQEDIIESPQLVRDRILHAVDIYGDPRKIYVNPDCGLRTQSLDVAYQKLTNMVEGAYLARERF